MEGWTTFWGWTLVSVLIVYTLVTLFVTIGGFADIKTLLRALGESDSSDRSLEDD